MPLVILLLLAALTTTVSAQLSLPGYLPQQCATSASRSIEGATDGTIVGILAVGIPLPLGGTELNIGMSMDDGRSSAWIYLVRSEALDTVAATPLIRLLGSCTPPPIDGFDPGAFGDLGDVPTTPLPTTFIQGSELVGAVKANADYRDWAVAHPDSAPSFVVLSVADDQLPIFPAGTPFWLLNWIPGGFGGGPGGPGGPGGADGGVFVCVVNAQSGETLCFGEEVTSVQERHTDVRLAVAPNPAYDIATITVPESWLGTTVSISATDVSGRTVPLLSNVTVRASSIMVPTSPLSTGVWSVRVSDGSHVATVLVTIAH
jgi:hypothetical protein